MSKPTQLIVNGITLPYTSHDKYQSWPEELGTQIEMISGRVITEVRGHVQKIRYQYDYMGNALWRQLAAVLRSGGTFPVTYLPDDGDELVTGTFICEKLTNPSFAFARNGQGLWHNVAFALREVEPHD